MRVLRQSDYKIMPWKNGGGITTEIAAFPADAGLAGKPFQWRVSIADVASDGPFSTFAGYERHIMLLEGKGMRLHAKEAGVIDLAVPYRPASFSGDWAVSGALIDGPVRDFNLMVARQSGRGALACQELSAPLPLTGDGSTRLIHCIDGEFSLGGHLLASGETVILDGLENAVLAPLASTVLVALCSIYQGQGLRM